MPEIITVRKVDFKGDILTLEQNCLQQRMLPSLAYGFKTCSQKFKAQPQDKYCNHWEPAKEAWSKGEKCIKLIGYDADEPQRAKDYADNKYTFRHPLIEWDWGRRECEEVIQKAGLPLPGKSSCFFCPSMRKKEILDLRTNHRDLLKRALKMELRAKLRVVAGLGRSFSWLNFVRHTRLMEIEKAKALPDEQVLGGGRYQRQMFTEVCEIACGCYDG